MVLSHHLNVPLRVGTRRVRRISKDEGDGLLPITSDQVHKLNKAGCYQFLLGERLELLLV